MNKFTTQQLIDAFHQKQYFISQQPFQVNIFGVRLSDDEGNTFNDCVGILWKDNTGTFYIKQYDATTDPGTYYRLHPMNPGGCACMIPGQYKNAYKVGLHDGYRAMQQINPISYIRDNSKTSVIHWYYKLTGKYKVYTEVAATNIHHAYKIGTTKNVDNWSAGCQVFANIGDFNEFIAFVEDNVDSYKFPNLFTYTLFESNDIK